MDVRQVAQCLQGVEDLVLVDDDTFQGTLRVKMGPASFAFGGEVRVVRRDRETLTATLSAQALDRGAGGGFKCELTMRILQETATLAAQGGLPRNQGGLPRNQGGLPRNQGGEPRNQGGEPPDQVESARAAAGHSQLTIALTTDFLGRLGQLGRPLIKRKITTMLSDFAGQVHARCAALPEVTAAGGL